MSYEKKYLKYKSKYLHLKAKIHNENLKPVQMGGNYNLPDVLTATPVSMNGGDDSVSESTVSKKHLDGKRKIKNHKKKDVFDEESDSDLLSFSDEDDDDSEDDDKDDDF